VKGLAARGANRGCRAAIVAIVFAIGLAGALPAAAQVSVAMDVQQKAAAGDPQAESMVASAYAEAQNFDQARAWFARAAQHGAEEANAQIADLDRRGVGHHTGADRAVLPSGTLFAPAPSIDIAAVTRNLTTAAANAARIAPHPSLFGIAVESDPAGGEAVYGFLGGDTAVSVSWRQGRLEPAQTISYMESNEAMPLPAGFLDLAAALSAARTQGMTTALQSAALSVRQIEGRPARAIWQIIAADKIVYYVDAISGAALNHSDYTDEDPLGTARLGAGPPPLPMLHTASPRDCPGPPSFTIGLHWAVSIFEDNFCTVHPGCSYVTDAGERMCQP
jgi:hypothetical protein